ncbi:MAG TPA: type II toxin-antitoxin system RelE/ParE family toxin [Pseudomonas sp.]|jgi:plasmid stabilization system protein ParE|uniref:type II toxin-antitoxin system RelE/ParE family toxin n=1 Tax=Pseudomonas sp. TaxID=306 RepID=UPI002ED90396
MAKFKIQYASTAEQSLYSQITHLQPHIGNAGAQQKLSRLIIEVEALLSNNPLAYPVSSQASLFGITQYRELNHEGYRIFYESFENEQLVVVGLILAQKQSVEDQLIHYCLMFDR